MGHLVLAGAGHAHMTALTAIPRFLEQGHAVTVVGPDDYHYYSGMGPGLLGGTYEPDDIRFAVREMAEKRGAAFVRDRVARIDGRGRTLELASGRSLAYDVLSCNIGSYVPLGDGGPAPSGAGLYTVKPIESLLAAREHLRRLARERAAEVVVVGGGPAGLEVAGNVWQLGRAAGRKGGHAPRITVLAGKRFMGRFLAPVPGMARRVMDRRGIVVREGVRARTLEPGRVVLDTGEERAADVIFVATGVKPSRVFARSGLPLGPDGGLAVNRFLQCAEHPEIFGGGDCVHFSERPLDKVGVYAVRQNAVLVENLLAALAGRELKAFDPGGGYLLVFNVGGGKGILRKGPLVFGGRPAFWVKDWIDRRFMRHFQNAP
jgi:NADH dehydrogenase FAD-containing subunit